MKMSKIVYLFPGQGAQYAGMGKEFYEAFPESREVFHKVSDLLSIDMKKLCFEENQKLHQTQYTQAAILTVCAAIFIPLKQMKIHPFACAGLSLGEYGALFASQVMSLEDGAKTVRARGIFMEEAYPEGGAMAAVLGAEEGLAEQVCERLTGQVWIANYNCPGQIVITGTEEGIKKAGQLLKEAGVKRVLPLKVSGPFHSPLLAGAGKKLRGVLEQVAICKPVVPYVANVTADYVTEKEPIKDLLEAQVSSPVRFEQSIRTLLADGADTFLEIGPGHTLSAFVRKIDKEAKVYQVEKPEDLKKLQEAGLC